MAEKKQKLGRKKLMLVLFALLAVNLGAGLLMVSSPKDAPEPIFLPDFESTLQLVSVADQSPPDQSEVAKSLITPAVAQPEQAAATLAVSPPEPPALSCLIWGPYNEAEEAERLASALADGGAQNVEQSILTVPKRSKFMVYIGPYPSRKAALAAQPEIAAKGLETYVLRNGRYRHAISVGLFMQSATAAKHLKKVKNLGFNATQSELKRFRKVHQVTAHLAPAAQGSLPAGTLAATPCSEPAAVIASAI